MAISSATTRPRTRACADTHTSTHRHKHARTHIAQTTHSHTSAATATATATHLLQQTLQTVALLRQAFALALERQLVQQRLVVLLVEVAQRVQVHLGKQLGVRDVKLADALARTLRVQLARLLRQPVRRRRLPKRQHLHRRGSEE
jgi:hypothetical protein